MARGGDRPKSETNLPVELTLLALLALLWGSSYVLIKVAVETIPPVTLIAGRVTLAAAFLIAVMGFSGERLPRDARTWRMLFVQAVLNSIGAWTVLAWGQQYVDSGLASVLNSTSPIFVFFITLFVTRHEATGGIRLLGACLGVLGVTLIVGTDVLNGLGQQVVAQLAVLLGAVLYAGAAIYGKRFSHLAPTVTAAGTMIWASACLVPLSLATEQPWTLRPSALSLTAAAVLAVSVHRRRASPLFPAGPNARLDGCRQSGLSQIRRRRASGRRPARRADRPSGRPRASRRGSGCCRNQHATVARIGAKDLNSRPIAEIECCGAAPLYLMVQWYRESPVEGTHHVTRSVLPDAHSRPLRRALDPLYPGARVEPGDAQGRGLQAPARAGTAGLGGARQPHSYQSGGEPARLRGAGSGRPCRRPGQWHDRHRRRGVFLGPGAARHRVLRRHTLCAHPRVHRRAFSHSLLSSGRS